MFSTSDSSASHLGRAASKVGASCTEALVSLLQCFMKWEAVSVCTGHTGPEVVTCTSLLAPPRHFVFSRNLCVVFTPKETNKLRMPKLQQTAQDEEDL